MPRTFFQSPSGLSPEKGCRLYYFRKSNNCLTQFSLHSSRRLLKRFVQTISRDLNLYNAVPRNLTLQYPDSHTIDKLYQNVIFQQFSQNPHLIEVQFRLGLVPGAPIPILPKKPVHDLDIFLKTLDKLLLLCQDREYHLHNDTRS